jgi:hypothetical protein
MVDFAGRKVHSEHLVAIDVNDDTVVTEYFGQ